VSPERGLRKVAQRPIHVLVRSRNRFLRALAPLLILIGLMAPAAAQAATQSYKGSIDFWQDLDVTVTDGQITQFKGIMGAIPCKGADGTYLGESDTFRIDTRGPFEVVDGHFHFTAPPAEQDPRGGQTTLTVDGDIRDGGVSGTFTVHTDGWVADGTCDETATFEAAPAPSPINYSSRRPNFTGAPVSFKYSKGRITQVLAAGSAFCNNDQDWQLSLDWYSNANHADPIAVDNRGRFSIDTTGVSIGAATKHVVHVVLKGQIKGNRATGTLVLTGHDARSQVADCRFSKRWSAQTSGPVAGPDSPSATFSVLPLRDGRAGSYTYWLEVHVESCTNAQRAQVKIAGRTRLTRCNGRVLVGPLTPKRIYTVTVIGVKMRNGKVRGHGPANVSDVYLPGSDGYWVPRIPS
jgi:hypothetical protein